MLKHCRSPVLFLGSRSYVPIVKIIDVVVNLDNPLRKELFVNKIFTSQLGVYPKMKVKIKYNFLYKWSVLGVDQQLKKFALKKIKHAPSRCILQYPFTRG